MSYPAVLQDENRHTCIAVSENRRGVQIIRMSATVIEVTTMARAAFEREYTPLTTYPVQRAAECYLFTDAGIHPEITPEARAHLERIAGPAFVRDGPIIDAPKPTTKEPDTMSEKTTAAPAKRKKADAPTAAPAKKTAAPAKKAAAPAKKAAAAAESSGGRGRAPNFGDDSKIKVLVKENPKRAAAAERFNLYKNGMTVGEYVAAGGKRADVNWDVKQGFIEVK